MLADDAPSDPAIVDIAVNRHVTAHFPRVKEFEWPREPLKSTLPELRLLTGFPEDPVVDPWSFITVGCWRTSGDHSVGHEYLLMSQVDDPRHVETLAMVANHQADPEMPRLNRGKVVDIGIPWIDGSEAHHLFAGQAASMPESFDRFTVGSLLVHFVWLLPIYEDEVALQSAKGSRALEDRLIASRVDLLDPQRPSSLGR